MKRLNNDAAMTGIDSFTLEIQVTDEYISRVSGIISRQKKKGLTSCLDLEKVLGGSFTALFFDEDFKLISSPEASEKSYIYDDIKLYTMYSDGLFIRMRDKSTFFIPAGNTEEYNEELLLFAYFLQNKVGDFRFDCHSRLAIPDGDENPARKDMKKLKFTPHPTDSPVVLFIGAAIGILMGILMIFGPFHFEPVSREDAEGSRRVFEYYEMNEAGDDAYYIYLYFNDGCNARIHHACATQSIRNWVEELKAGTRMIIYKHPESRDVIEIIVDDEVILDMDTAQRLMKKESDAFGIMGIFLFAGAGFLAVYAGVKIARERKTGKTK